MTTAALTHALPDPAPGIDFDALVAERFHPEGVRDRIVVPVDSPTALDEAVARAVAASTNRPGRHNRYVPVPGELALRTDDLVDFLYVYGHEYQLAVFRAADVRTGGLLHVASVEAEAQRQSIATVWDWTGAPDWLPIAVAPSSAVAVFWAGWTSLVDGQAIAAGLWRPADGDAPSAIADRPRFTDEDAAASRVLAAAFADGWLETAPALAPTLRHPGQPEAGLPVVVLETTAATAVRDAIADAAGVAAAVLGGDRLTVLLRGIDGDAARALGAAAAAGAGGDRP